MAETKQTTYRRTMTTQRSTYSITKKNPVDFDDELKIGDVRYDDMDDLNNN